MHYDILNLLAANSRSTNLFSEQMSLWEFVSLVFALLVLVAGIASLGYILWWGILLILSWGKEDKIKPAINSIRYALVWVILIVVSIFLFPRLAGLLGLDVKEYGTPDKIFSTLKEVWNKALGSPSDDVLDLNDPSLDWFTDL